jgi:branched-chain amino acid transport system permease protein
MDLSVLVLNLLYALALAMNMFIIAAGLSLIFGVLRVINFAHGAFYMVGAYLMYSVTKLGGGNVWLGVAGAGLGMAALALAIERGLLRFLYGKEHLMQLLFSFAIVLLLGDVVKMIWGVDQHSVDYPPGFAGAVDVGIASFPAYLLLLCAIGPVLAVALWLTIDRTRWGRIVRAATQDREMLSALGINVPLVYAGVFTVGSALAGIGGALAAPRVAVTLGMDATIIVECFIIVIIGGLGQLWGSFLGALAFGFVVQFGTVWLPDWQDVLPYLMMLAVLLIRPWGLLGQPEAGQ